VRIGFRLVDVFTDRPLAGNQLCVVPDGAGVPDDLMQAIAREIGVSETTFVMSAGGDRYAMRIFTPAEELPFAGHPSLGTAFVLVLEGRIRSLATQSVKGGEYRMEVDVERATAWMDQGEATFGAVAEDLRTVAEAAGLIQEELHPDLPPQVVSTGLAHLVVPARTNDAVRRAWPDQRLMAGLMESFGTTGYYLASVGEDRAHARLFGAQGIMEDAATGSAAGPLGAYLVHRGAMAPGRLTISQGAEMGRPSTLLVDVVEDGGVRVGGGVAIVGLGEFDLDLVSGA